LHFSYGFVISLKSRVFLIAILITSKIFVWGSYFYFLKLWSKMLTLWSKILENVFCYSWVLDFYFPPILTWGYAVFSKIYKIAAPYCTCISFHLVIIEIRRKNEGNLLKKSCILFFEDLNHNTSQLKYPIYFCPTVTLSTVLN